MTVRHMGAIAAGLFLVAGSAGGWGRAIEVPGMASLSGRTFSALNSISCGAPGDCAAGGFYGHGRYHVGLVVSETNGKWGKAIRVPGTATLGGGSQVASVSCAAAGDCAAGGYYSSYSGGYHSEALVVSETNGHWGNAIEVPGTATLNTGGRARVNTVSCSGADECAAGGFYLDGNNRYQAFVATETNGTWGNAVEIPGAATPYGDVVQEKNGGVFLFGAPGVATISCAAPGECAGGGSYYDHDGQHAFVAGEANGSWGGAIQVPATHNAGTIPDRAKVDTISCAAPGECAAGGYYAHGFSYDYSDSDQAFVVNETNGTWGAAIKVPGTAKLNTGGHAGVDSISCVAAGECVAGGSYDHGHSLDGSFQAFVVSETNGSWGTAMKVPGTAALNTGHSAGVDSISCVEVGECAAAGSYWDSHLSYRFFVDSETNGAWGTAIRVPGAGRFHSDQFGDPISISCPAAGRCAAGGDGPDRGRQQAFVVGEK